jgi:hypothetical protein
MKDILSDRVTMTTRFIEENWIPEDGEKADVADIILRHIQQPSTAVYRRINHTGDGQGATENNPTGAYHSGAAPAQTPEDIALQFKPDGVTDEEWLEHSAIMRAIKEWQLTHVEDEPFLDPEELRDPRVRMWREKLRQAYNFNKRNDNEHKAER